MNEDFAISDKSWSSPSTRRTAFLTGGGILLTMLPVTLLVPVLKELVSVQFEVSNFWAHAFMSTSLIGGILAAPLAGMIIDRSQHRRLLIVVALVGNALCFAAMALAPTFLSLMTARFIEGAMHITALTAWMATAADLSPRGRAGRIMGVLGGLIILGITIGVPLGGVVARHSVTAVLWFAALFSILAALLALPLRPVTSNIRERFRFREYYDHLRTHPELLIPYAYSFIDRLSIGVVVSTLTIYMSDILALTPAQRGIELSFFLLPFALLSYPVGRLSDRIGRSGLMVTGSICFGIVFMSYGYVSGPTLMLAMVASGLFSAAMFTPTLALCKDLSPFKHHGIAFSGYNIAGSLGFVVGPLIGGGIFTFLESRMPLIEAYRGTFVITGIFEIACALISLPFLIRLARAGRVK